MTNATTLANGSHERRIAPKVVRQSASPRVTDEQWNLLEALGMELSDVEGRELWLSFIWDPGPPEEAPQGDGPEMDPSLAAEIVEHLQECGRLSGASQATTSGSRLARPGPTESEAEKAVFAKLDSLTAEVGEANGFAVTFYCEHASNFPHLLAERTLQ